MKFYFIITGGTGTLGKALCKKIIELKKDSVIVPLNSGMVDITNPDEIRTCFEEHKYVLEKNYEDYVPIVIHCAAMIGAKPCNIDPVKAHSVNTSGTLNVAHFWETYFGNQNKNSRMIYISTDYVFDGCKGNYDEMDLPNPISIYASTKYKGEKFATERGGTAFRLSFMKDDVNYPQAYSNKRTSGDFVSVIAELVVKVIIKGMQNKKLRKCDILHIGTEPKTFYDLVKRNNPDCVPVEAPEGTPLDTTLNIRRMNKILL